MIARHGVHSDDLYAGSGFLFGWRRATAVQVPQLGAWRLQVSVVLDKCHATSRGTR